MLQAKTYAIFFKANYPINSWHMDSKKMFRKQFTSKDNVVKIVRRISSLWNDENKIKFLRQTCLKQCKKNVWNVNNWT